MSVAPELAAHLDGGLTTLCRCWVVRRADGVTLGFTDHDRGLAFGGVDFRADSGLTARAVEQTSGLSVDNSEAMGVLSDAAITDADIEAGRYDAAEVEAWLVNWSDVAQRHLLFRGSIGEIRRKGARFEAELRGLAEALNHPQGRVYQAPCGAVLGDGRCGVDLEAPGLSVEVAVEAVSGGKSFHFSNLSDYSDRWFERGTCRILTGGATGLVALVKNDRLSGTGRDVELWEGLRAPITTGDMIRLEAGCDKAIETCRLKFDNVVNFRGFPTIPGEDWLMAVPSKRASASGGGGGK